MKAVSKIDPNITEDYLLNSKSHYILKERDEIQNEQKLQMR